MAQAVRPGGRVILSDDDCDGLRLWPEPPGFAPVWIAYQRTYDRHGNDPFVGRAALDALISWSNAPDSAVRFGMSWAEGIRPA